MVPPRQLIAEYLSAETVSDPRDVLVEGLQGPDGPEELLLALKSEAERYWTIDPYASLRLGEARTWAADEVGRPDQHALGVMAVADALRFLGRYAEAMAQFETAAREFLAQGAAGGWARTRIGWANASSHVGPAEEVFPVAAKARAVLVAHEEWFRAAALALNTANVYRRLGQYSHALAMHDEALRFYERASDGSASLADQVPLKAALVTANKANIFTLLGEFSTSLQ